jgi:NAD(P)-dependent dehydrogenase (short-subunit alcohol dehydrogenase family)
MSMGETVLVTGGSGRGIGRAITVRLLADGYNVVNFDIQKPEKAGANEQHYQVDMMDRAATAATLARATKDHTITRLVNCLGIVRPATVEKTTLSDFDAVVEINLRCALQCMQALLPAMERAKFGRVVNITTRAAVGKELRTAYSATKAGLHGLTKTWALELGDRNITINAVAPGPIDTEMFRAVNPPDSPRTKKIIEGIPLKRMGTPEDIAHATAFFLEERSGYITGQILYVCGGITVGLVA